MGLRLVSVGVLVLSALSGLAYSESLTFSSEQTILDGTLDLEVLGYSVPSMVDWNSDGKNDLLVGEGGLAHCGCDTEPGKVRVYLNNGTNETPAFSGFSYVQSGSEDLEVKATGCLGAFPRAVQWDDDGKKDLIVGLAGGRVKLFMNIGTDNNPVFDSGTDIVAGLEGGGAAPLDVGLRATPSIYDWNLDGKKDILIGDFAGQINVYINEGTDVVPELLPDYQVQGSDGSDLRVAEMRSSPQLIDMDNDGKRDLVCGNTAGQLLVYFGTDDKDVFDVNYELLEANGVYITLPGENPRSRPSFCDFNNDGYVDILVGSADGKVHLYLGVTPEPATMSLLALGGLALIRRKRRAS